MHGVAVAQNGDRGTTDRITRLLAEFNPAASASDASEEKHAEPSSDQPTVDVGASSSKAEVIEPAPVALHPTTLGDRQAPASAMIVGKMSDAVLATYVDSVAILLAGSS